MIEGFPKRVEITMGKEGIALYEHFILSHSTLQRLVLQTLKTKGFFGKGLIHLRIDRFSLCGRRRLTQAETFRYLLGCCMSKDRPFYLMNQSVVGFFWIHNWVMPCLESLIYIKVRPVQYKTVISTIILSCKMINYD